jgi:uncharacterized protein (TIGR03066 family)
MGIDVAGLVVDRAGYGGVSTCPSQERRGTGTGGAELPNGRTKESQIRGDISEKEPAMNVLRLMAAGVIVCVLAVGTRAGDEKDYPKLVVGKWKVVKASPGTFPLGTVLDLSKDDKVKVVGKRDGKEFIHAGTYKVDGAKILITVTVEGKEQIHTLTITKISDTDVVTDHGGGGTIEFSKEK